MKLLLTLIITILTMSTTIVSETLPVRLKDIANIIEARENQLSAKPDSLVKLGLRPTLLREALLEEVIETAKTYAHRCDRSKIPATSRWVKARI